MIIQQQDLDQEVNRVQLLTAFTNTMIDMSDQTIRGMNDASNLVLIQTDDQLFQVVAVKLVQNYKKELRVTDHQVVRTYSARNMIDTLPEAEHDRFPPSDPDAEVLQYLDVIQFMMQRTHGPDEEWTQHIIGVDAPNKMLLVYEESLGQALEVPFIVSNGEVFLYGLPRVYWDWYDCKD